MDADYHRVTMIMGAGAVLDMSFPCNIINPSTWNITNDVRRPYDGIVNERKQITIVDNIYQRLVDKFPINSNIWWDSDQQPNIHFEILFHVMEQLMTYGSVWSGDNHNPSSFPYFAPFTANNFEFDREELRQVMWEFIIRIMDIVNAYDEYFRNDNGAENWYRDFFKSDFKWDVFNFNYDTTVENSLGKNNYEDGFESKPSRTDSIFRPKKLFDNIYDLSTINHIHGCINYYYKDNPTGDLFETNMHDLYLYPTYNDVRDRMTSRGQSNPSAQNNEEYFAGPIITGLRKTEKLSCMPYDAYHGHLYKSVINNNAMVIVGYSFGDLYVNNLINRMHAIWGGKERIVLIDKWDDSKIMGYKTKLNQYLQTLSAGEIIFLETMSGCSSIDKMIEEFIDPDVFRPKRSTNGCLMLVTSGMKIASSIRDEIYSFLES